jgi:transposase
MARESDLVPRVSEIAQLPADIDALHVLVAAARAERDAAIVERDHALSQIDRLRHLLRQLQRAQFGRRSEKLDPEQLLLALEDIEQAIAGNEAADDKKDPVAARARSEKRRANRGALPIHLPHVDVTIEPEDTNCPCCRAPMHVIGEETSQRLDVIPAQFRVVVTHRPKYACRACEQAVVQAPAPERLIKGGLPTEAMVAYVLVAKYAWHLPLYRQAQMLLAQGLDIKRAILAFWVGYAAAELKPLYLRLRELILASGKIAVDETVAPVLDPGRGRTKKGYFWAIARDDRPWGGTDPPAVAYSYAPGRGAVHALKLLEHSRHRAMRRICRLQEHCRRSMRRGDHARFLLGPPATQVLRYRQGRLRSDRKRSPRAHRGALCDREDDPGAHCLRASCRAPGAEQASRA